MEMNDEMEGVFSEDNERLVILKRIFVRNVR